MAQSQSRRTLRVIAISLTAILLCLNTFVQMEHYRFHEAHAQQIVEGSGNVRLNALPVFITDSEESEDGTPFTKMVRSPCLKAESPSNSSGIHDAVLVVYKTSLCPICELASIIPLARAISILCQSFSCTVTSQPMPLYAHYVRHFLGETSSRGPPAFSLPTHRPD